MTNDSDFKKMGRPKPGEWLFHAYEPGQSFKEYVASRPARTTPERQVLAFLPAGPFKAFERHIVDMAVIFAGIWFDLPTRIEPAVALPEKGWHRLEHLPWRDEPLKQYQTAYFLNKLLPKRIPKDAYSFLAITMADLYPDKNWGFVFGQASRAERIGVFSLARYFPGFWGKKASDGSNTLALKRSCKLVAHEIGHVFGLAHCIYYQCAMNGSNSLDESEGRPLNLCPICLRKLHWNRGFDIIRRYERLWAFCVEHDLKEQAAWLSRMIQNSES